MEFFLRNESEKAALVKAAQFAVDAIHGEIELFQSNTANLYAIALPEFIQSLPADGTKFQWLDVVQHDVVDIALSMADDQCTESVYEMAATMRKGVSVDSDYVLNTVTPRLNSDIDYLVALARLQERFQNLKGI